MPSRRKPFTRAQHRARHKLLHQHLDELMADYLAHTTKRLGKLPSNTTLKEFMEWSYQQTLNPTDAG